MASPSSFFPQNFLLQMQTSHEDEHQLSNLHDLRGMNPMVAKRSMSFSGFEASCNEEANADGDLSDDGSLVGEKKKRLNSEQVRALEKNFELANKLEPERKIQLARALGLKPRQVAIWFQNRRARWKTKQLEKDYDVLKKQFDAMKSENEALYAHNKKLQDEILALKGKRETQETINLNKETEGSCSNRSDNSSEINLDISRASVSVNESPLNPQQCAPFYHPVRPADLDQFLQSSSRPDQIIQCPKTEDNCVVEGHFSNLLCGIEDQSAFWNWSENHQFH